MKRTRTDFPQWLSNLVSQRDVKKKLRSYSRRNFDSDLGVSEAFLTSILRQTCSNFMGVYSSRDQTVPIPETHKTKNHYYIFNLEPLKTTKKSTGHFVALLLTPNQLIYYDPLGRSPYDAGNGEDHHYRGLHLFIEALCLFTHRACYYYKDRDQSEDSTFCGLFCMLRILYHYAKYVKQLDLKPLEFF